MEHYKHSNYHYSDTAYYEKKDNSLRDSERYYHGKYYSPYHKNNYSPAYFNSNKVMQNIKKII